MTNELEIKKYELDKKYNLAEQKLEMSANVKVGNENLATIANQNMSGNVPDWMKQQYQSDMNAQLGGNAAAPIGAEVTDFRTNVRTASNANEAAINACVTTFEIESLQLTWPEL